VRASSFNQENPCGLPLLHQCRSARAGKKFRQQPAKADSSEGRLQPYISTEQFIIQNQRQSWENGYGKEHRPPRHSEDGRGRHAGAAAGILTKTSAAEAGEEKILRAGIITDMHKTSRADSSTRIYSAASDKMKVFINAMQKEKSAFIIELGDFVDTLARGTDPAANLRGIEALFTSFEGPAYHVLGNHDFDNLRREDFLSGITNTGIEKGRTYYSFDAGAMHCIVLDADYTPGKFRPYDMPPPKTPSGSGWTPSFLPMKWNGLKKISKKPKSLFWYSAIRRSTA